jgi:hypothetical protein
MNLCKLVTLIVVTLSAGFVHANGGPLDNLDLGVISVGQDPTPLLNCIDRFQDHMAARGLSALDHADLLERYVSRCQVADASTAEATVQDVAQVNTGLSVQVCQDYFADYLRQRPGIVMSDKLYSLYMIECIRNGRKI